MAIFYMQIKSVARSSGRTATAAAAYRAGERIRDERTGALYNHSKRDDVLHKEIFLPSRLDRTDAGMEWARERSTLWNAAEKAGQRSDSRVAREYQVALPAELSPEQRVTLAPGFFARDRRPLQRRGGPRDPCTKTDGRSAELPCAPSYDDSRSDAGGHGPADRCRYDGRGSQRAGPAAFPSGIQNASGSMGGTDQ